jgi:hypothetical protein
VSSVGFQQPPPSVPQYVAAAPSSNRDGCCPELRCPHRSSECRCCRPERHRLTAYDVALQTPGSEDTSSSGLREKSPALLRCGARPQPCRYAMLLFLPCLFFLAALLWVRYTYELFSATNLLALFIGDYRAPATPLPPLVSSATCQLELHRRIWGRREVTMIWRGRRGPSALEAGAVGRHYSSISSGFWRVWECY